MNQASISKRTPLHVPPDRIHQLPCHPELAALPRFFEQPGANWYRQRRTQPDSHDQGQRDPALAVQKRRPIGLVAVIVFDADPRPELRAARNQRIVEDQGDQFGRAHPQHQLQQTQRQFGDRHLRPLDELVIGGPVRLSANRPDGARDPAFRVEQAADQEFDEGPAGTRWHGHQKKGNPFREQQANVGSERHEGKSGIENDPSLVAARCLRENPAQAARGDLTILMSCQVFFAFFPKFFTAPECLWHPPPIASV
jgi:hypothetical protein